jgi:tetratricopeptide (TPR) repeat protein
MPLLIITGVTVMVGYANWRDLHDMRADAPPPSRSRGGAPQTSREDLELRVKNLDAQLLEHRFDASASVLLADTLLRQARVTGHAGPVQRAEQILRRLLTEDPGNYEANRILAAVYLAQHRFRDAIVAAEKNRARRPLDAVNYGALGDAHLELGEYAEAFDAFDRMMALRPSAGAYARVAYARELQGNLEGAVVVMKLSLDATAPTDFEALAWTHTQLGNLYMQLRKLPQAKQAYAAASQAFPGHPSAVIGYAAALTAEGDLRAALALLQTVAINGPTPDLAARMGDLLERVGQHGDAQTQYALAEAGWRADTPEPARLARLLVDHRDNVEEGLRIAERAARERRDIFTMDSLAWAYFKAGRMADASRTMTLALRTGTRDADIRAHALLIDAAAGQVASR